MTFNAKQFDTGRKFVFNIMDNDEPFDLTGCNTYLRIAKADGTQFQGHECCTIDDSNIIIDTSVGNGNQILTAPGTNKCELHIEDQNGIGITTWNFNIYVESRVHNGENISSYNSYDVLDNMISMEKERILNEKQRKNNELIRVDNENKRILDENERQKNETERQETFGNVLAMAESYATTASICAFNANISQELAATSANEAESWVHGKTGIREGEETDNAKYWCMQSESYKNESKNILDTASELLEQAVQKIINVNFEINDDGELEYESDIYEFEINDNGELEYWVLEDEGSNI